MTDPAPAAAPAPRFLTDKPRLKTITLDWPVAVGAVEYRAISVVRLTTGEVDDYLDRLRSAPDGVKPRWPVYDAAGAEIPDAVWAALDPDDTDKIGAALNDFLPARFRTAMTDSGSTPSTSTSGDSTSVASPAAATTPAT